ncbi:hypothetical protein C8N24_6287 [Solirubrobacter pauli]|uniref:Uncharacterized protein n=1 Tax=Solirubrobacter pauli TaxID=166793 RepID=A0A660L4K0_9ACTN|nr:hypothetical protein [Solirubrobacter pauli]RKQ88245.1 hypothetical protein C8N24_6287 [Solirubrobacter pauli]
MTVLPDLERQVRRSAHATHPAPRPQRRGRVIVPVAALALAAASYALLAPSHDAQRSVPPADEREVTAPPPRGVFFTPDPDKIVYVRSRTRDANGGTILVEEWHRGREDHRVERWRNPSEGDRLWEADRLVSADGVMRQINEEGEYRVIRPSQSEDAANVSAQRQAGFLADFRANAEKGTPDPTPTVFADRPALRYHVRQDDGTRTAIPTPERSYYVDRDTGRPLGMTSRFRLNPDQVLSSTQTVEAIEELDPTPQNLAKLREFVLERR